MRNNHSASPSTIYRGGTIIKTIIHHSWDLSEADAKALQQTLASRVIREDRLLDVKHLAGVDVAYDDSGEHQFAAAVVLEANTLNCIESATVSEPVRFPYIPGLFSFREVPSMLAALNKLKAVPDLIVCDGQGLAHPRRFGLACHLGVLLDIPTIGCGKTKLLGRSEEPGAKRGDQAPLIDQDEIIGCTLRTQDNVKPIYVSIGHRISLKTACHWILHISPRYRLPETTRQADQLVRKCKKEVTF